MYLIRHWNGRTLLLGEVHQEHSSLSPSSMVSRPLSSVPMFVHDNDIASLPSSVHVDAGEQSSQHDNSAQSSELNYGEQFYGPSDGHSSHEQSSEHNNS